MRKFQSVTAIGLSLVLLLGGGAPVLASKSVSSTDTGNYVSQTLTIYYNSATCVQGLTGFGISSVAARWDRFSTYTSVAGVNLTLGQSTIDCNGSGGGLFNDAAHPTITFSGYVGSFSRYEGWPVGALTTLSTGATLSSIAVYRNRTVQWPCSSVMLAGSITC